MRQGQQNRRGRGRGRKVQNPLSRSYESNGPEVKIRGNASHIAEKYAALARDAQASGDPIMAENYLQHAEHYYRIIMAAQAQTAVQPQPVGRGRPRLPRRPRATALRRRTSRIRTKARTSPTRRLPTLPPPEPRRR